MQGVEGEAVEETDQWKARKTPEEEQRGETPGRTAEREKQATAAEGKLGQTQYALTRDILRCNETSAQDSRGVSHSLRHTHLIQHTNSVCVLTRGGVTHSCSMVLSPPHLLFLLSSLLQLKSPQQIQGTCAINCAWTFFPQQSPPLKKKRKKNAQPMPLS